MSIHKYAIFSVYVLHIYACFMTGTGFETDRLACWFNLEFGYECGYAWYFVSRHLYFIEDIIRGIFDFSAIRISSCLQIRKQFVNT